MRDTREEIGGYTQCEKTDATRVPGDDIIGTLKNRAKVLTALCNDSDAGASRPTYGRKSG